MATFKDTFKYNLQEGFREAFESRTGILGDALRARRERQEQEQQEKEQIEEINNGTTQLKSTGVTLGNLEKSFIQISRNLQLIAKSMKAQVTLQEETDEALIETKKAEKLANKTIMPKIEKDEDGLFDKVLDLLDGWGRGRRKPRAKRGGRRGRRGPGRGGPGRGGPGRGTPRTPPTRVPPAPERGAPPRTPPAPDRSAPPRAPAPAPAPTPDKGAPPRPAPAPKPTVPKAKIKEFAVKRIAKALGKMGLKSIPILGAAVGVGFAIGRLIKGDPVGAGLEAVGSLGSAVTAIPATILDEARSLYIEIYGVYPEEDPAPDKAERWKVIYEAIEDAVREELRSKAVEKPEVDYGQASMDMMGTPMSVPLPPPPAPPPLPRPAPRPSPSAQQPRTPPAAAPTTTPAGASTGGSTAPTAVNKPGAAATLPPSTTVDQKGNAARLAAVLQKYGITNPYAKTAIISTAAKESGLNPASKELGANAWLRTIDSQGVDYVWRVLPQLGPRGRVAVRLGYPQGMPADVLRSYFSKGDESFFELVYGMIPRFNPNPGDGYKYRGRGFVQLTGRSVYAAVSKQIGIDIEANPDQVLTDFDTAAAALAGYMFMTRGGKDKALKDLNAFTDVNSALRYVLHSVAGLGKDARQFDVADSTMRHQLEKASKYVNLAAASSGADIGNYSITPAMYAKGTSFSGPSTVVVAVQDEKKAAPVQVAQPRVERPAQIG